MLSNCWNKNERKSFEYFDDAARFVQYHTEVKFVRSDFIIIFHSTLRASIFKSYTSFCLTNRNFDNIAIPESKRLNY